MYILGNKNLLRVALLSGVFLAGLLFFGILPSNAATADQIAEKNRQIEELQKQIEEYQQQIDANRSQAASLQGEINRLNALVNQVTLEIKSLGYSIDRTSLEIGNTQKQIEDALAKLEKHKGALGEYIRLAYEREGSTLTEVLLNNDTLSDFFSDLNNIKATQDNLRITIEDIKELKSELDAREEELEGNKTELEKAKRLQEIERSNLDGNKKQKDKILRDTKGQEAKYQELVKLSQKNIEALRAQVSYLLQNGITAEEAVKYGQLAAIGAGIRPEYLLAELEQESALGSNVGKCYIVDTTTGTTRHVSNGKIFSKGIHPTRDLPLFLNIVQELGKDPLQTPISCGSSWGGAMGAAQFIPSTWMGYRDEVARLTGHALPNPWNIEDAFTAAAAKLSRDGASSKTREGEIAASKRYYCGSATSRSSGCVNYANSVQRKATEIAKNL